MHIRIAHNFSGGKGTKKIPHIQIYVRNFEKYFVFAIKSAIYYTLSILFSTHTSRNCAPRAVIWK